MNTYKYSLWILSLLLINACSQQTTTTKKEISVKQQPTPQSQQLVENKNSVEKQEDEVLIHNEKDKSVVADEVESSQSIITEDKTQQFQQQSDVPVKNTEKATPKVTAPNPVAAKTQPVSLKIISGTVSLNTDAVKEKDVEITETVVYFKPFVVNGLAEEVKNYSIASQNKRFVPNVLAIQKGSSVTFPNMDRILHNVFSVSNVQKFDLGLYSAGQEKTVTFENAGIVYVHCNVHHSMQADILVLDTPFYTHVDANGNFSLENLPSQNGDLYIWHPRAKLEKISMNPSTEVSTINKTLAITRKKIPAHLNKFGTPYRPTREDN